MSSKVKLGTLPLIYPIPIVLVGALVDDRPNFATIGDCGLVGIRPPLVSVSLHADHYTTRGIREHGAYSINIPCADMLVVTDYCGIVSGRDVDKSALFDVFYGEIAAAPLIAECPVNIECRVVEQVTIQHRQLFIAEVVQTHVSAEFVTDDGERKRIADLGQLAPIIYALDNRYYAIGPQIGTGYQEGKAYRPE